MIEQALAQAMRQAQGAEIALRESRSSGAEYEDDKLKKVEASQTTSVSVRVIVDGKVGQSHGTDPQELESVVARAIALAEFGSEAKFAFPGPASAPGVLTYDPEVERITREEMVAVGGEMLELVKTYSPEIKVSGGAGWSVSRRRLMNSSGLDIGSEGTRYGGGVGGVLIRGTDILWVGRYRNWRKKDVRPRELAGQAIALFRDAERIAPVDSRARPVIFTPRGLRVLTYPLQLGINGKNVLKGDSPLAGKLGQRIVGPAFSLTDDGTVDYAPDSGPYDGEGVPRQRNEVVKDGVLTCFLYDLDTAAKAGAKSTGNGPGSGVSNLLVGCGESSFAEMVKNTDEGHVVENVLGLGQGNVINGEFSVNIALGYKIERGEIVGRVKDVMLAGNAYDALNHITAIGSDCEWSGAMCAPYLQVEALSVVGKG
jgi:PmbA protein